MRQHLVLYYEHTLENPLKADDTDPKNLVTTTAWEVGEWGGHHNIKKTSGIVL